VVALFLFGVYYEWITVEGFVYATAVVYFLALITMFYALVFKTQFSIYIPKTLRNI
jgi:hypothetical protein